MNVDLITDPTAEVGFRTAGLYWRKNSCNELADRRLFKTITKRINGGYNRLEERTCYYIRAKASCWADAERDGISVDDNDFTPVGTRKKRLCVRGHGRSSGTSRAERFARCNEKFAGNEK